MNFINRLYEKKISSKGLGIFRILFASVLLCEIIRIYRFRELYYDFIPFLKTSPLSAEFPYYVWMLVVIMLIFGVFTRIAAIINYLFILIYLSSIGSFEYHMDYVYTGVGFLLIFISASKSYSIDHLLEKLKYSDLKYEHKPIEKTSVLSYWLILFVGLILFYTDSIYFKFVSELWSRGLGMWLPSSLPQITIVNSQWFLNQEILIKFLGYLTFAFELLFPFLFWIKKMRIPLLIIGLGLHIGIYIEFPIPYFALGAAALYILLVPNSFWVYISSLVKSKTPSLTIFYDDECPLCLRTKFILKHFDVFGKLDFKSVQKHALKYKQLKSIEFESLLNSMHAIDRNDRVFEGVDVYKRIGLKLPLLFPIGTVLFIPGVTFLANKVYGLIANNRVIERCNAENCGFLPVPKVKDKDGVTLMHNLKVEDVNIFAIKCFLIVVILLQLNVHVKNVTKQPDVVKVSKKINNISSKLLGITAHGVFLDGHFRNYKQVYTLGYEDELLPIYKENGMCDDYLLGGTWVNFNFRVNLTKLEFEDGMSRYSAFWAGKNGVSLKNETFKILMREVRVPRHWEENVLANNMSRTWKHVGEVQWKNDKPEIVLYNK